MKKIFSVLPALRHSRAVVLNKKMSCIKTYIFVFQILLLTSCAAFPPPFNSTKKLKPDSVEIIKKEQVIGSYSWSLRGHSSEIILKENDSFTKNIQNSFYKLTE